MQNKWNNKNNGIYVKSVTLLICFYNIKYKNKKLKRLIALMHINEAQLYSLCLLGK